jgi:protocatechuate 3,4-dioxygenase beta subunit
VIDGVSGEPIADAVVSFNRFPGARMAAPGGASPAANLQQPVVTGADGRFVFRSLPPGNYPVIASLGGYVSGMVGQGRPGGPDRALDLADGERVFDATIRLWKHAVITGSVVDEAGDPAVELTVNAYRRITVDGRSQLSPGSAQTARTDDRGRFRFSHLTPGDYVVVVPLTASAMPSAVYDALIQAVTANPSVPPDWYMDLMLSGGEMMFRSGPPVLVNGTLWSTSFAGMPPPTESGRTSSYRTTYYPAATSSSDATVITVRAGEERHGVNLQLALVPTARISGTVQSPTGNVANLAVRLQPVQSDPGAAVPDLEMGGTVTRPDGSFTFHQVPAGQYLVRIVRMGRSEAMNRMLAGALGGGAAPSTAPVAPATATYAAEQLVTVGDTDVTGVSLVMREGPKVSGRVEFELTPPRTPAQVIAGGAVVVTPLSGASGFLGGMMGSDPSVLEAEGRFRTLGYPPDKYVIGFGRGGRGAVSVKSVTIGGRDMTNAVLELRDADVSDVVITVSDRFGTLAGVVRGANGAAATTATAIVFPVDYRASVSNALVPSRTQIVAASRAGAYAVSGLVPGNYFVVAVDDADVSDNQDTAFFDALARAATRITVGDAEKKTQDLVLVKVKR